MPSVKIELPFIPVSVNAAFASDFKTKRRFKTKDYAQFQRQVFALLKAIDVPSFEPMDHLSVEIRLTRNWYTQKGLIRKTDVANYEKTLIDTVFPLLGLEDSQIFQLTLRKDQHETLEKTTLSIYSLTES